MFEASFSQVLLTIMKKILLGLINFQVKHKHFIVFMALALCACEATQNSGVGNVQSNIQPETAAGQTENSNLTIPPELLAGAENNNQNEGLANLKGIKGVKVDHLFSENLSSVEDRTGRLEGVVTDIYRELETLKPAIVRLVAIEKDIQDLVEMLSEEAAVPEQAPDLTEANIEPVQEDVLAENEIITTDAPTQPAEEVVLEQQDVKNIASAEVKSPEPAQVKAPQMFSGQLRNIRVGEHSDFLRIVIDLEKSTEFSLDLDQDEQLLSLVLPSLDHPELSQQAVKATNMIDHYILIASAKGSGSNIIFALNEALSVKKKVGYLDSETNLYKIVIDLEKL